MQRTYSMEPLERIAYFAHSGRQADVYLRENIQQETEDGETRYSADEVHITTDLTREEVEESFDMLWVKAENDAKPLSERLDEVEDLLGMTVDLLLGGDE